MKTKIISVSPDQNVIEHESGLKTAFVPFGKCFECIYSRDGVPCEEIPCDGKLRSDNMLGCFKTTEQ